jgi:hypothetical protein
VAWEGGGWGGQTWKILCCRRHLHFCNAARLPVPASHTNNTMHTPQRTCMQKLSRLAMSATPGGGATPPTHFVARSQAGCTSCQLPGVQSSG